MAYSQKIPPIKAILTRDEFNTLVEVVTNIALYDNNKEMSELSSYTREKILKYSSIKEADDNIEISLKLHINESVDIITILLSYLSDKVKKVDYFQLLQKICDLKEKN